MNDSAKGWLSGFIAVVIFSGSLPATKIAVMDLDPYFLSSARAVIAAVLGIGLLVFYREKLPVRRDLISLIITSLGVVIGFPFLTALALKHIDSAHSIVFIGLLPLSTAAFGVLRGGERPRAAFWFFSFLGSLFVAGFAWFQSGSGSLSGNLLMLAAIIVCGLGYAEGGKLSRTLGGWQVICWSLVLALPLMLPLAIARMPVSIQSVSVSSWLGLAYVSVLSMLIGFIFWYRGLALGGIAAVGQLQLLQPPLGLMLAAGLLREHVSATMIAVTVAVIFCVAGAKRFSAPPSLLTPNASNASNANA